MKPIKFDILRPVDRYVLYLFTILPDNPSPQKFCDLARLRKLFNENLVKNAVKRLVADQLATAKKEDGQTCSSLKPNILSCEQLKTLFDTAAAENWRPTCNDLNKAAELEVSRIYRGYGYRSTAESDLEFSLTELLPEFICGVGSVSAVAKRTLNGRNRNKLCAAVAARAHQLLEEEIDFSARQWSEYTAAVMPYYLSLGFATGAKRGTAMDFVASHLDQIRGSDTHLIRAFSGMCFWLGRVENLNAINKALHGSIECEPVMSAYEENFARADRAYSAIEISTMSDDNYLPCVPWQMLAGFVAGVANPKKIGKTRPVSEFKKISQLDRYHCDVDSYQQTYCQLISDAGQFCADHWKSAVNGENIAFSSRLKISQPLSPTECLMAAIDYRFVPTGKAALADLARQLLDRTAELANNGYLGVAASVFALLKGAYAETDYSATLTQIKDNVPSLFPAVEPEPEWKSALAILESALPKAKAGGTAETNKNGKIVWYVELSKTADKLYDVYHISPALRPAGAPDNGEKDTSIDWYRFDISKHRKYMTDQDYLLANILEPREGEIDPDEISNLVNMPNLMLGHQSSRYYYGYEKIKLSGKPMTIERGRGALETVTREDGGVAIKVPKWLTATDQMHFLHLLRDASFEYVEITPAMHKLIEAFSRFGRESELILPREAMLLAEKTLSRVSAVMPFIEASDATAKKLKRVKADVQIVVRLRYAEGALDVRAVVKPLPENPAMAFEPGMGAAEKTVIGATASYILVRDLGGELAALKALEEALGEFSAWAETPWRWKVTDLAAALQMLAALKNLQPPTPIEWLDEKKLSVTTAPKSGVTLASQRTAAEWFSVNGEFKLDDGRVLGLMELINAFATREGNFVKLSDGDYLALTEAMTRQLAALRAAGRRKGDALEIMPAAVPMLDNVFSKGGAEALELPGAMAATAEEIRREFARRPTVPATLNAELRPYQEDGFRWLSRLVACGFGACLADDMGLGKTVQTIALLLTRAKDGPTLVLAPSSVCGNWRRELVRFAPSLKPVMAFESLADFPALAAGSVVIASYGFLLFHTDEFESVNWNGVVLDEAQAIKNDASKRAHAVKKLKAKFRLACTGTPVENRLGELWSLFDFLNPGLLGPAASFTQRFTESGMASADLKRLVKPLILRRLKGDVLTDLPEKTEITLPIELGTAERTAYEACRRHALETLENAQLAEGESNRISILAELTRLRRFCCHPSLVMGAADVPSAKLEALVGLLEELRLGGHRALVFSQFTDYLAIVRKTLDARCWHYKYLDGSTPTPEREKLVNAFQSGEGDFFLISLKAGGTGLNLTAADYVLLLDPWWNPAVENQAADRAHRIGQQRPVTVYRLIAADTVEERVLELHREKQAVAEDVLDGTGSAALTAAELMRLFS